MTWTLRQSSLGGDGAAPWTATLGQAPLAGSHLFAVACERSGATDHTMNSTGWSLVRKHFQAPADLTWRKSLSLWHKPAGAGESSTASLSPVGGSGAAGVGIAEFTSDANETLTLASAISTGYDDSGIPSMGTGTLATVPAGTKFYVGACFTKTGTQEFELPYSDWANMTEFAMLDQGFESRDLSWSRSNLQSGFASTTAAKFFADDAASYGGIAMLSVFEVGGGAVTYPDNLTITASSPTEAMLQWDNYPGAIGYQVERDGIVIATPSVSEYLDPGRTPEVEYDYRVRARLT